MNFFDLTANFINVKNISFREDVDALDQFLDELIPVEGVRKDLLAIKLRILISGAEDIFEFSKRSKFSMFL